MDDFKDYSDDQLISQFKLLADEIIQRNADIDLANSIDEGSALDRISSLILFKQTSFSGADGDTSKLLRQIVDKFQATTDDLSERVETS